ncbi:MAG: VOC family protein [Gammaproteobacteria bacterium]|nr:VOC family protein [Gammaproteobacteria bacterium]MDH3535138.1 VOC family protein [Gammaproteobacteria bacterium]
MELGAFSISLAVKDIQQSRQFYEKLGFTVFGGEQSQNWLIMKNGAHAIGLFQGMFDQNILTFNPGWDSDARPLEKFTDVRELQQLLMNRGVEMISQAQPDSTGPASFVIADPDGNTILVDQHV